MLKILKIMLLVTMSAAAAAGEWQKADIEMSDGKALSGELSILGSRPLTIMPAGSPYERKILLDDIISISQIIEKQEMNKPWKYKEDGKIDKIYFDGTYPFVDFGSEVVLTNGQVVRGHIISIVFKFKGEGAKKIFLYRQIKGEIGQTMSDIVYPVKITFTGRQGIYTAPITGSVDGYGKLLKVSALDNQRETVCFATVKNNSFEFNSLLPGTYDIFILTDSHALGGMSGDGPENLQGSPLPENAMDELKKVFPKADDFFNDRWILELAGNTSFAKTLAYFRRADVHAAERHLKGGFLWHLDIWSWHLAGSEWKIDRRYIMLRHKQHGGEMNRKFLMFKQLEAVKPGTAITINAEKDGNAGKFIRNLD
jgi:hypothetical protein